MPQLVRPRFAVLHGTHPAAPLPQRFRSLADREAVEVLHRAARVLVASLPALTDRLVEALYEQEPGYRAAIDADRSEVWQEVHHSLRHNVGSLLQPKEFRDAAHRTSRWIGEIRAGQGVPLDAVLHAFRMGGAMVWQDLVDETARRDPDDVRLLVHVAADVWNFVDEHCGIVADAYRQAERRLTWQRENRQRLVIAALLDGTARIADLGDAAAMLGLPEQGRYAVLAVASVRRGDPGPVRHSQPEPVRPLLNLPSALPQPHEPRYGRAEAGVATEAPLPGAAPEGPPGPDVRVAEAPAPYAGPAGPPGIAAPSGTPAPTPSSPSSGSPATRASCTPSPPRWTPPTGPGPGSAPPSTGWPRSGTPGGWRRPRCGPVPPPGARSCSTSTSRTPSSSPPRPSAPPSPPGCSVRWTGSTPRTGTSSWRP